MGSLIGGRWSDYSLAKSIEANGGVGYPEVTSCYEPRNWTEERGSR
jgi:hypothetical protein